MAVTMESSKYKFRKACLDDAVAIHDLVRKAFVHYSKEGMNPAMEESLEEIYNDIKDSIVLILEKNGRIIGSLRLVSEVEGSFYLKRFSIDPSYQDQGLGTILYSESEKAARDHGGKFIYLYSSVEDERLINFYRKLGFSCLKLDKVNGYQRGLWVKKIDGVD
ncbi:GNAT family N-acetyltransferase [Iocasia frigidifontis]|uniref:GNAT family N-acetyltransferase n=1 Tax=Iocasia fonsfrigidae TaxID=2682810 RepID=A0A8A7K9B0_9FIRM|nr:GNAT family N-acetyltransferase [Iocasia fonsfrigidae]QTL98393.1 GNAT family N-acetyltransferase [Iocasia fonsfrigidae]